MTATETLLGFQGRIGRGTWWLGTVGFAVGYPIVRGVTSLTASVLPSPEHALALNTVIYVVCGVPMVCVSLALDVKRFHDHGMSGWWVLFASVPIVGPIARLVICGFLPGNSGSNRFGPERGLFA